MPAKYHFITLKAFAWEKERERERVRERAYYGLEEHLHTKELHIKNPRDIKFHRLLLLLVVGRWKATQIRNDKQRWHDSSALWD